MNVGYWIGIGAGLGVAIGALSARGQSGDGRPKNDGPGDVGDRRVTPMS